jgi:hypothetical protein
METRTQQFIRAFVGMHVTGFPNFQEQESFIQDVFRFVDERNLDVDALVARAAAYPGGERATLEALAVAITVAYMHNRADETLAQNHRDVARALFDIPINAKPLLGTFEKVPSQQHIRDYVEKHGMFTTLQDKEDYVQRCFAYATVRKLAAILLNREFHVALEHADPECARGVTYISNVLKRHLDLYSEKAPFCNVDLNELVEIVAGHIDNSGMKPDALLAAAQRILDDWEAR